jgi:single-stranded DNA-binding protein
MIEALISGKLIGAPDRRTSKGGKPYVQARMRVPAGAEGVHFVRLTAFSDTACTALLALSADDALAVAGTLKAGVWAPQNGEPRVNLDLVAAQVLTVYHLERRRRAMQGDDDGPGRPTPAPAPRAARQQEERTP